MDVVNAEQVTWHHSFPFDLVLIRSTRLASQKRQVLVPSWHSSVFRQTLEQKVVSREW